MKVYVPRILAGLVACLMGMQSALAQTYPAAPGGPVGTVVPEPVASEPLISDAPGQAAAQNYFGYTEVDKTFEPLIRVDTRGGTLYGQGGFTRLSLFETYWLERDALLFLDAGGFAAYNPSGGANVGIGWRWYNDDFDRITGINGWWDFDAGNERPYNQFGVGFESLGRYLDYRANGYFPIEASTTKLGTAITGPARFYTNYMFLNRFNRYETVYTGFDLEMGGPLPFTGKYGLNAYVGTYFFVGRDVGNVNGVSARLQGQINEDWTVGAQVTHDSVFETNAQMQITLTIPDGAPSRWLRPLSVRDRLTAPVVRNYRVVTNDHTEWNPEVAINPVNNQPFFVVFVDPNKTAGTGTGTFEDPYSQISQFDDLALAQKSGINYIIVSPRDDNTSIQLDTGVTLLSNQHLLSTSVQSTFTALQGTFDLPGFVEGAELPILSNTPPSDVVTFANGATNVEVGGFEIVGSPFGRGIVGTNNSQVNIHDNIIRDGLTGISLTNLSGTAAAGRASIFANNQILNNGLVGLPIAGRHGLEIINNPGTGTLDLAIVDNVIAGNGVDGVHLETRGNAVRGLIDNNTTASTGGINGNGRHGFYLFADGGSFDFFDDVNGRAFSNNTVNFNGFDGLHIDAINNSTVAMRIIDNVFGDVDVANSSNNGFGIFYSADSGTGTMLINGNEFFANGFGGIRYHMSGNNVTTSDISENTLIGNTLNAFVVPIGLEFQIVGDTEDQPFSILNTSQAGVTITGFNLNLAPSFTLWNTNPLSAVRPGVPFTPLNGSEVTTGLLTVNTTPFPNADPTGGLPDNQALLSLAFNGFDSTETFEWNADTVFQNPAIVNDPVLGNNLERATVQATFNVPGGFGSPQILTGTLQQVGEDGSRLVLNGQVNQVVQPPNNIDAIQINATGNSRLINSSISNNTIRGNSTTTELIGNDGYGIRVNAADTARVTGLNINDNVITGNDGGIHLGSLDNAIVQANLQRNVVTQSTRSGLELISSSDNASALTISMADNEFSDNTGNGVDIRTRGAGHAVINSFRDQTINNTLNGFNVEADGDSTIEINLYNLTSTDNDQSGVNFATDSNGYINALIDSITDSNFDGTGTTINNNLNGITGVLGGFRGLDLLVRRSDTTQGLITDISDNIEDGVDLRGIDSTTINATFIDTNITGNGQNGISMTTANAYPADPTAPNTLNILRSHLDGNGATGGANSAGLDINTLNDSMLLVTVLSSTFDDNAGDGIRIFSGDSSSFGNTFTNERSTFDNISVTGNGGMGIRLFAMGNNSNKPTQLVDINSDSGDTIISDNAIDGIHATVPYGTIDLQVRGTTLNASGHQTLIQRNGDDGIEFNVANLSQDLVPGTTTDEGQDDAIYVQKFPPSGLPSPPNFDIDLTSFDAFNGVGILNIDTVVIGDNDSIHGTDNGNAGNGIQLFNSNGDDFAAYAVTVPNSATFTHLIDRAGSLDVTVNNSIISSNGADGINYLSQGLSDTFNTGNRNNVTVINSSISYNLGSGVNILLNGKNGDYDTFGLFGGTFARTDINQFVFTGNTIDRNGNYGFYYEANAGAMTRRDFLLNTTTTSDFWGLDFFDPTVVPGDNTVFDPDAVGAQGFAGFQAGYSGPFNVPLSNYMNLITDINAALTFNNNNVRFNGATSTTTGDGMFLRLGTDTYLSADLGGEAGGGTGNVFAGNTGADVRMGSFVAYDRNDPLRTPLQPGPSTAGDDTADPPVPDHMFLDDTAQLDLRFNNNVGRKFDANVIFVIGPEGSAGLRTAAYDNPDPFKGGIPRPTQLFQVDDGVNLNANNSGWLQDLENAMGNDGNFHLRTVADPLFPNPAFPVNYNTTPGDPFLP